MNERHSNPASPVYDRALLLHGSKRNEMLTLAEIEQYGLDSFAHADYISIYGMPPREWYRHGIRLLGRTAVECTREALGERIGLDVASVAARMPSNQLVVIDPFAGSCNTLFWILRHLPSSEGIAFESDPQLFELTHRNLAALDQRIELVHGDYVRLLEERRVPEDRGIVAFVAPPWGTALDEVQGLDLGRTTPPISEVIEQNCASIPEAKHPFCDADLREGQRPFIDSVSNAARLDRTAHLRHQRERPEPRYSSGNERLGASVEGTRAKHIS